MKNFITSVFLLISVFVADSQACVGSAVSASPATSSRTPTSGDGALSWSITVSLDCVAGESYTITPTSPSFGSSVGSSGYFAQAFFFADPAMTQHLISYPITGTASTTGTQNITVYGVVQGTSGVFQGLGGYGITMQMTVTSTNGSPVTITHVENGVVQGSCAVGNATANFNNVAGPNPIVPVSIPLNCTSGLQWSMSQLSISTVTIGGNAGNTGWLYSNSNGTGLLNSTPMTGTGTGLSQNVNLYAGLAGSSQGSAIVGNGAVDGVITVVVTY